MIRTTLIATLLTALTVSLSPSSTHAKGLPATLVDSFDGWTPTQHPESWKLKDGELLAENDPGKQGSTLWTDAHYGDFVMELEFRFGEGTVDSGVFIRKVSEQVQIGNSGSMKRDMTASPYISGKGYPVEAKSPSGANGVAELLDADGWNAMKIMVIGARYDVWLNGHHVTTYVSDDAPESGPIGLQIHPDRTMSLRWRNVRLAELTR